MAGAQSNVSRAGESKTKISKLLLPNDNESMFAIKSFSKLQSQRSSSCGIIRNLSRSHIRICGPTPARCESNKSGLPKRTGGPLAMIVSLMLGVLLHRQSECQKEAGETVRKNVGTGSRQ